VSSLGHLTLVASTPPAPVLEELLLPGFKAYLRVDGAEEDAVLSGMLGAARYYLEGRDGVTHCALLTQTWDWAFDRFPSGQPLVVPLPPLQSITSIKVRDAANVETTWAAQNYQVDLGDPTSCGRIVPVAGAAWPVPGTMLSPITVRFVAGYGSRADALPDAVKYILYGLAASYYTQRDVAAPAPVWIDRLLDQFRVEWA
jgi:uncharacterized phiE125 gp8 family phage protein